MKESGKDDSAKRGGVPANFRSTIHGKRIALILLALIFLFLVYDLFLVDPEKRLLSPDFADNFLLWVEANPGWGLLAIVFVIAGGVVSMVPIGTPLTIGCGYIYRSVYGWRLGLLVATAISMVGSCLGAVICFILGRYLMRASVKQWTRKYPLFDAIDIAARDQGLKIMSMLYLTPVMPLGLMSYMCGTTSMNIYVFAGAKIVSFPLYLGQTFLGASAHALIRRKGSATDPEDGANEVDGIEDNMYVIVGGLILSLVMVALVTKHIRKELLKILDSQKKDGFEDDGAVGNSSNENDNEVGTEMGVPTRRRGVKTDAPESSGLPGDHIP